MPGDSDKFGALTTTVLLLVLPIKISRIDSDGKEGACSEEIRSAELGLIFLRTTEKLGKETP